jgi:hypothetical protein
VEQILQISYITIFTSTIDKVQIPTYSPDMSIRKLIITLVVSLTALCWSGICFAQVGQPCGKCTPPGQDACSCGGVPDCTHPGKCCLVKGANGLCTHETNYYYVPCEGECGECMIKVETWTCNYGYVGACLACISDCAHCDLPDITWSITEAAPCSECGETDPCPLPSIVPGVTRYC